MFYVSFMYMTGETQDYFKQNLQNLQMALQNISEWYRLNGMLLNTRKTKAMSMTASESTNSCGNLFFTCVSGSILYMEYPLW